MTCAHLADADVDHGSGGKECALVCGECAKKDIAWLCATVRNATIGLEDEWPDEAEEAMEEVAEIEQRWLKEGK